MPTPGPLELVIILVIALLILGPGKLPDVGSALGKSIKEFRKASSDVQEAVTINVDTSPLPPAAAVVAAPAMATPVMAAPPAVAAAPVVASPVAAAAPVAPEPAPAPAPYVNPYSEAAIQSAPVAPAAAPPDAVGPSAEAAPVAPAPAPADSSTVIS